jgi:hypothetical protein
MPGKQQGMETEKPPRQRGGIAMTSGDNEFEKLEAQVREWKRGLQELEAEIQKVDGGSRFRCSEKIKVLHQKREEVQQTLARIRKIGRNDPGDFKEDLNLAWTSLKENVAKAKSEFKRGYKEGREK